MEFRWSFDGVSIRSHSEPHKAATRLQQDCNKTATTFLYVYSTYLIIGNQGIWCRYSGANVFAADRNELPELGFGMLICLFGILRNPESVSYFGDELRRKRKTDVEPVFGNITQNMGITRLKN